MPYPIFVINLAHHPKRWEFVAAQLRALGLSATRIEAVNGYDPAIRAQAAAASYAPLAAGEIGCFESHRKIWRRVVDEDLPAAVVLEDDVAIAADFAELNFPETVLKAADVIKLDQSCARESWYGATEIALPGTRHLQRLLGSEMSTGGYLVTRRGAERLLGLASNYILPVDDFMFSAMSKPFWKLEVWKLAPAAVVQLHMLKAVEGLQAEMQDRIQQKSRVERAAGSGPGLAAALAFRLRRLLDRDVRFQRQARQQRHMEAFRAAEGILRADIPFASSGMEHVARAEACAFDD